MDKKTTSYSSIIFDEQGDSGTLIAKELRNTTMQKHKYIVWETEKKIKDTVLIFWLRIILLLLSPFLEEKENEIKYKKQHL